MNTTLIDPTTPEGKQYWQRRHDAEAAAIATTLASEIRAAVRRISWARWNGEMDGPASHELYLAETALTELAEALDGGSCEQATAVAVGAR